MGETITIKSGDIIKHNGINFVFLGRVDGNLLCVTRKTIGSYPFDDFQERTNFYPNSSVCTVVKRFVEQHLDSRILAPMDMDLSPYGESGGRHFTDICGLLSSEQCQKYKDFLPNWHNHVWTLTPLGSVGRSRDAAVVAWPKWRELLCAFAWHSYGVSPACLFASEHLKLRREAQGIVVEYDDSKEVSE